ncbi:MAG: energy transducer TonB [Terracidiphilus sp.]
MRTFIDDLCKVQVVYTRSGLFAVALLTALSLTAASQTPIPPSPSPQTGSSSPEGATTPTTAPDAPSTSPATPEPEANADAHAVIVKDPLLSQGAFSVQTVGGEIKEDQLKPLLIGKTLYLRAGYLDNTLEFDEHGRLLGHSPQGSYTLNQIQINKVKLSKRKLELEGDRYGLHFLGAAPFEDPTTATDRVKITPKKKAVRISFDREQVEIPKKKKQKGKDKHKHNDQDQAKTDAASPAAPVDSSAAPQNASSSALGTAPQQNLADGRASSDKKVTTTTSPAHASQLLLTALDKVFSIGIDERMIAAMPDFWKLYYQAAANKVDFKPADPGVFHLNAVDQKAKLISALDPPSNEFAQASGVAGMALYHTVVGTNGKVEEIVAGRPIGFGLDESAEQTIRKATFQPAMKDGKPVPVALDVVVSFRIYSKRTSQPGTPATTDPTRPGPYTVRVPAASPPSPTAQ